ncbi:MAG: PAS domain S-box protein [Spirochaetes bacterium]|nr:PAS domain S-box protein [Spirochaetota bacterium]
MSREGMEGVMNPEGKYSRGAAGGRYRTAVIVALSLMAAVLVAGAGATHLLNGMGRAKVIREERLKLSIAAQRLIDETDEFLNAAEALAGSPMVLPALTRRGVRDLDVANSTLDRYATSFGFSVVYLLDAGGTVVASSNRREPDSFVGESYSFRPYFLQAVRGSRGYYYSLGITSGKRGFYASSPVRNPGGGIAGVAVVKIDMEVLEKEILGPRTFFIDPSGIVFLTDDPSRALRSMWPLDAATKRRLAQSRQFGPGPFDPLLMGRPAEGTGITVGEGEYLFVSVPVGEGGWRMVHLADPGQIYLYRFIGILSTLLLLAITGVFFTVVFLYERSSREIRERERRLADIINFLPDATFAINGEGIVIAWNLACEKLTGVPAAQMLGKGDYEHSLPFYGDRRPALLDMVMRPLEESREHYPAVQREGDSLMAEVSLPGFRDQERFFWVKSAPLYNSRGAPTGALETIRDITERRRWVERIRESEERLKDIVEHSTSVFFSHSIDGSMTYVSPNAHIYLECPQEEVMGHWSDFISDNPANRIGIERTQRAIETGQTQEPYELEIITRKGRRRWAEVRESPVVRDGRTVAIVGSLNDITERKAMEQALRESEKRYRLIADNTADNIWIMGMDYRFTFVSPSIVRVRGYTVEEAMAQTIDQVLTPESLEIALKLLQEEMELERAGTADRNRTRILVFEEYHKEGHTVWVENSLSFFRDESGVPVGILGISRDITERKVMEQALRESEKRYRLIADNTADIIWVMGMDFKMTFISPSVLHVRGYTVEEAMAQTIDQVLTPESLELAMKALQEEMELERTGTADRNRTRTLVLEEYHKEGRTVWLENSLSFMRDENGEIVEILGVCRDVSARKTAEEQIKSLLKEKELLLREVHHRIKNNMLTISSLLELQMGSVEDGTASAVLRDARGRIQSMMVIYDMLYRSSDFRKISMKQYLSDLMEDIAATYTVDHQRIRIRREIADASLDTRISFPLGIIVNELVSNALKYAFPGDRPGRITVRFQLPGEGRAVLTVEDNGIGLPASLDLQNPGGFGLSLVQILVQQVHGTMSIERRKGSAFIIEFPVTGVEKA